MNQYDHIWIGLDEVIESLNIVIQNKENQRKNCNKMNGN